MTDVTEAAVQVGRMMLHAIQNALGLGPDEALEVAKAETGVTDDTLARADMGEVFDYVCGVPGLDPQTHAFLASQATAYNTYGTVDQSGSTYSGSTGSWSGGGSGGSGGAGGAAGGSASTAQIVQQVTQNYSYQEINDNHIDVLGPVHGGLQIDQDNDDVDVTGDGNVVHSGDGPQNASTGDGSSAAQAGGGDAQSQSGDGQQVGDIDAQDSAVGLGGGETGNMSHNYLEEGAAGSGTGDANGHSADVAIGSDVDSENGPGDLNDLDVSFGAGHRPDPHGPGKDGQHDGRPDGQPDGQGHDGYQGQNGAGPGHAAPDPAANPVRQVPTSVDEAPDGGSHGGHDGGHGRAGHDGGHDALPDHHASSHEAHDTGALDDLHHAGA